MKKTVLRILTVLMTLMLCSPVFADIAPLPMDDQRINDFNGGRQRGAAAPDDPADVIPEELNDPEVVLPEKPAEVEEVILDDPEPAEESEDAGKEQGQNEDGDKEKAQDAAPASDAGKEAGDGQQDAAEDQESGEIAVVPTQDVPQENADSGAGVLVTVLVAGIALIAAGVAMWAVRKRRAQA